MTTCRRLASFACRLRIQIPLWIALCVCGFGALWMHAADDGETVPAASHWPSQSPLTLESDRATLLLFVHPRCPCTRASLHELQGLARRLDGRARVVVIAATPETAESDPAWVASDVVERARSIPGADVLVDVGAVETSRFGALTSGETRLYGPDGRLLFQGGITSSRGHIGPSAGSEAIFAKLCDGESDLLTTPVFGCALVTCASTAGDTSR